jgi:hypothetical protein
MPSDSRPIDPGNASMSRRYWGARTTRARQPGPRSRRASPIAGFSLPLLRGRRTKDFDVDAAGVMREKLPLPGRQLVGDQERFFDAAHRRALGGIRAVVDLPPHDLAAGRTRASPAPTGRASRRASPRTEVKRHRVFGSMSNACFGRARPRSSSRKNTVGPTPVARRAPPATSSPRARRTRPPAHRCDARRCERSSRGSRAPSRAAGAQAARAPFETERAPRTPALPIDRARGRPEAVDEPRRGRTPNERRRDHAMTGSQSPARRAAAWARCGLGRRPRRSRLPLSARRQHTRRHPVRPRRSSQEATRGPASPTRNGERTFYVRPRCSIARR